MVGTGRFRVHNAGVKWRSLILVTLLTALVPGAGSVWAGAIEGSYRQARQLIDQSLAQMDSAAWLARPTPLLIETRGALDLAAGHLGARLDSPSPAEFHETWAWDPESGALGREVRMVHTDGYDERFREIFLAPDQLWRFDLADGTQRFSHGPQVKSRRERLLRRFVPLLLTEALQNGAALRFTGRYGPFDSVQMQTAENEPLTLFFGRESRHLGWVEYLTDLPTFGDSTVSWKFMDYRTVERIGTLPHRLTVQVNDANYLELEVLRVEPGRAGVDAFLALDELPEQDRASQPAPRVEHVGGGVHRIAHIAPGTHMLAVEFADFLLVADAPATRPLLDELPASMVSHTRGPSALSRQALDLLEQAIPGKPVRYVMLSHFHSDSAGGLLAFSEPGAEVLVHASQSGAVDAFLAHAHTLCGVENPAENLRVNAVTGTHAIRDEKQTVELLSAGPNPHSEGMLLAWMPGARVLWVSDLQHSMGGEPDPGQPALNRFFNAWLEQKRIAPDLILTAHGEGFIETLNDFRVDAEQTHNLPRDP